MMKIPAYRVATDDFKAEILEAFGGILDSGMFVLGGWTERFESEFSSSHGRVYGVAVNSDTAALEAALQLLTNGDKDVTVLMPDTAFFGCANVALRMGLRVRAAPVTLSNGLMPTTSQLRQEIKEVEGKIIYMAVYTAGTVGSDAKAAISMCRNLGIPVVEDCAHVHGARYADGHLVGHYGDIATFSFYATKMIHTGEGGMLLVNKPSEDSFLRTYRDYGKDYSDKVFADTKMVGYNWRMTEFQAALGSILWSNYDKISAKRRIVSDRYDTFFHPDFGGYDGGGGVQRLLTGGGVTPNLYRYIVMVKSLDSIERNRRLYQRMEDHNISLQAKCNSKPLSQMKALAEHPNFSGEPCWGSTQAAYYSMHHICLPIYPGLTAEQAQEVAEVFMGVVDEVT